MRISDWSSDVCSSDLLFEVVPLEAREVLLRPDGIVITMPMSFGPAICDPGAPAGPSVVVATIDGAEQRLPVDDAPLRAQHARDCAVRGVFEAADKIGRASCRDRGCQYV